MHGTRDRILQYLIEHRSARVEDLAETLEISQAAVRRHLDNLRADGLADVRAVKQTTGRPYYAYHPTERAAGSLPAAYADLMARMLRGLGGGEGAGAAVMASVAEALASRHRAEVATTLEEDPAVLAEQVTGSLRQEGILDSWHRGEDGIHLVNGACPYRQAAEISSLPCDSDRRAIELLLGCHVEQVHRIVDGAPICEYLVHAEPGLRPIVL